jgi:hypothetical protein
MWTHRTITEGGCPLTTRVVLVGGVCLVTAMIGAAIAEKWDPVFMHLAPLTLRRGRPQMLAFEWLDQDFPDCRSRGRNVFKCRSASRMAARAAEAQGHEHGFVTGEVVVMKGKLPIRRSVSR